MEPIEFDPFEQRLFADDSEVSIGGSGSFNQLVWQIQSTGDHSGVGAQIITLHEWCHHEINNVTVYGGLLTACAQLAKYARVNRAHFAGILGELVNASREAHEVYATWYITNAFLVKATLREIISNYSEPYLEYFHAGDKIVKNITSPFLRQQAFISAIRICFESVEFARAANLLDLGDPQDISHVDPNEFPTERLKTLTRILPPDFFHNALATFSIENDDYGHVISSACKAGGREDFFLDIATDLADEATHAFLFFLHGSLALLFEKEGFRSNPFEYHLTLFATLIPKINKLSDPAVVTHTLAMNCHPHDNVSNLLLQMESEAYVVRSSPLPTRIVKISDVSVESWPSLRTGEPQHLSFCVRHKSQIIKQHSLSTKASATYCNEEKHLVFIRRRALVENELCCEIIVFTDPAELSEFYKHIGNVPGYATISMEALANQDWVDQWLPPLNDIATCCILFDRSIFHTIRNGWNDYLLVRYAKGTMLSGNTKYVFLVFLCLNRDGTYSLYLTPCSELLLRAAVAFIKCKLPQKRFIYDESFLSEIDEIVRTTVSHLILEEYYFSVNDISF